VDLGFDGTGPRGGRAFLEGFLQGIRSRFDVTVLVPHYSKLSERRVSLQRALERQGLSAIWITEFDQEDLTDEIIAEAVDLGSLRERAAITESASGSKRYPEKPLKRSEISIALKHLNILRSYSDSPHGYIVVMEDDVQFRGARFAERFACGLKKTPSDWDMIFFGESGIPFEKRPLRRLWNRLSGRTVFRKDHPATRCLDSYAIKSGAAARLVREIDRIALPIDWELNYWIARLALNVYWWEPGLTVQGSQTGAWRSSIRAN
jgi:GR25 family glycosyltransferase involved in LPS biosynthesis